jgi:type IV pilus assembly protein PilQ
MLRRMWMQPMLAVPVLLIALGGGAAAQQPQDSCLPRLPTDRVTLNLREANIQTTLRLLAQQYQINMVVTDDVKGTVTLDFFRVPARDVFQSIIDTGNLRCVVSGDVLRVSTFARIKAEAEEATRTQEARLRLEADTRKKIIEARQAEQEEAERIARGPVREETIRLRYADAEDVARTIQGILGLGPGLTAPALPLSQLSQLYSPSPPVEIPSTPLPPPTLPTPAPPQSPEVLAKGLTVQAYKPTNSVFIRFYSRDLDRIKKLITESLDVPLPQIQIAAQMVITSLNALDQIGVQWGFDKATNVGNQTIMVGTGFATPGTVNVGGQGINTDTFAAPQVGSLVNLPTTFLPTIAGAQPAAGFLLGLFGRNFNLSLALQALQVQGKARTLAEPKAVTVENAKASITRGFEVPFTSTPSQGVSQVQFKDALMKLEVTPRLIREPGENKIRLKVSFQNDQPDFTQSVGGNPSIFKRRQETEVVLREGQRLVIGGVTNDSSARTVRQVPLMGSIPVLGWLFKSREINATAEELIVILTPTVVSVPDAAAVR